MGPIITAIDEGHFVISASDVKQPFLKPGSCRVDGEQMPCSRILAARLAQPDYNRMLQQLAAIEAGKLSVPSR